jgi:hypothetical protein
VKEIAHELEIDVELVARDLEFHRGVGSGYFSHIEQYSEKRRWEPIAFAATSFRRAGSHALLLDKVKLAIEMFAKSADCYERLHRPYASMMWSLARNLQSASKFSERSLFEFVVSEGRYPSERFNQLVYPLLVESVTEADEQHTPATQERNLRFKRVVSELNAFSTTPLGMMGIPMASYLTLAASIERNDTSQDVEYLLLPFLNAYEVAVLTARSKTYHWRRLLMPFHPAEPDILSVLSLANTWFKRRNQVLTDFIRKRSESRIASRLLSDALERVDG